MPNKHLLPVVAIVALAFLAGSIQFDPAQAYRLPDTGQTRCYDDAGNLIDPCPDPGERFCGQDGNYIGPQPAFKDNNDGTVTDLNTDLIWQQGDAHNNSARTWQQAVDYCGDLDLDEKTDWRLPSRLELMSIVNYGRYNPSMDINFFPDCRSSYYWSGSTYAGIPDDAWSVGFDVGGVGAGSKGNGHYVRCVRAGP